MGNKVAARALARHNNVPTLPGTEEPVAERAQALKIAHEIGFPLIIKAAFGGGGRGMRVAHRSSDLAQLLDEAQSEAGRSFGNPAVFLEKYVPRAKHIEVQILGDRHGNVAHLHERDCSVQRRHQKVIEIAPASGLDEAVRTDLCQAAVQLARAVNFDNAGTVEFLYDLDRRQWFFIEVNPRIQVEHTVTEVITGVDLVRSQILAAQGYRLHGPEMNLPPQEEIPRIGCAVQCRVTTEDPENKFTPDYGKILTYRSTGGYGVRLDGGMGYAGAVITPFYDSLLVKITAFGRTFEMALQRMDRALREFRIRGVKTNIPFLENVIAHPVFRSGRATTTLIDNTPGLFDFKPRRDRATKLLAFLGDVIVNGNPQAKGYQLKAVLPPVLAACAPRQGAAAAGHAPIAAGNGRPQIRAVDAPAKTAAHHRHDLSRRPPVAAGHAPALLRHAGRGAGRGLARAAIVQPGNVGRGDVRHRHALSARGPVGATAPVAPARAQHLFSDALPRRQRRRLFQLSRQRRQGLRPPRRRRPGMDIFRIFDSLNYTPNLQAAMEAVQETHAVCEAALCYTGDILDPKRSQVFPALLRQAGAGVGKNGRAFPVHQRHGGPLPALRRPAPWSRPSRRRSACRSIFTPTTPAASMPPPSCKPAWRERTLSIWPSPP